MGKEIWDDIKGIFGGNKGNDEDKQADTNNADSAQSSNATSPAGNATDPSSRRFI